MLVLREVPEIQAKFPLNATRGKAAMLFLTLKVPQHGDLQKAFSPGKPCSAEEKKIPVLGLDGVVTGPYASGAVGVTKCLQTI